MNTTKLSEGIFQLSINVENILFEELWEIPNGATLNSYVVKGEKTAIIDGFCGWDGVPETLFEMLSQMDLEPNDIDYVVINHMEPDHSGWIEAFSKLNHHFEVVIGEKGADLLDAFFGHTARVKVVKDGDTLDLGNGRVFEFKEIPFVHWPDTIATFDRQSGTLFSCDLFGSFGTMKNGVFETDYDETMMAMYEDETVRYFANILGAYANFVSKSITQLAHLDIQMIAPGHGLTFKNPAQIISLYETLASYAKGEARNEVTILWGSMYGMTEKAVRFAETILQREEIPYHIHRVPETSWSSILKSVWTSRAVLLAMPTYEYKMFPPMAAVLEELGSKKLTGRKALRIGSYGWSGGAQKELDEIMMRKKMKWEFVEPVEFKGTPQVEDLSRIEEQLLALMNIIKDERGIQVS